MEGKLLDSLCCTDHTCGQDILHIFSGKQAVELLLIEAFGQDMLHEPFQFMGKITHWVVYSIFTMDQERKAKNI